MPLTGASPTFSHWSKATPGAPIATGAAMTELVGAAGGIYFVDITTTDGLEYAGQIDATVGAAPGTRYRMVSFSGTTDARLEVDIPAILADTNSLDTTKITTARADNLDEITAARLAELDAANLPADVDTLITRLSVSRSANLDFITSTRLSELDPANLPTDIALVLSTGSTGPWTTGMTAAQIAMLSELWQVLGLDAAKPLVVDSASPTGSRKVPADGSTIEQTTSTTGTTTTVTRS